ncbi:hypothetical protein, partial [Nocardia sp. NPDC058497]|uniref:hypothetical protein n=1 Tax=Nocardia sp. NPDC058497 TaxID=3346529 RepID=UPI003662592C
MDHAIGHVAAVSYRIVEGVHGQRRKSESRTSILSEASCRAPSGSTPRWTRSVSWHEFLFCPTS